MKKTSMIRSALRHLTLVALSLVAATAGWSYLSGSALRSAVSAQQNVTVVSAASFDANKILAPNGIAAAFGAFVTQNNQVFQATTVPLPTTLGGVRVRVGNTDAGLFFVSTGQINFEIPGGTADGANVTVTVTNSDNSTRTGTFTVVRSSPGIFSAKASGQGAAAAQTTFDGATFQNTFDGAGNERDVDAGTKARPNVLILYATGVRNTPAQAPNDGNGVAEAVTVKFQGVPGQALFAGPVQGLVGLDQINVIIPPEMAGIGSVQVILTTNGRTSNTVTIKLGGQTPPVRVTDIAFGQTATGDLAIDDQVQIDNATGKTFFFDAYRFTTTAANTTVAIDLRSTQFDAPALLYRIDNNTLTFLGADDQSGGYGNGRVENNNSLLLMVLPTPGTYVIFASTSDQQPNGVGAYSLKLLNNIATQLSYSATATNQSIANTDLQTSAGTYLDVFWFNGVNSDNVRANMVSTVFDSFLILQRNDGDPPIASDDNTGGGANGLDAQLTHRLTSSGIHILIATPFEPNKTGNYTLTLNKLAGFAADGVVEFNYRAPGRDILDERPRVEGFGGTSFERFGRRRIVEQ